MADFTWIPHRVEPSPPKYNVEKTEMEGMSKKTRLVSSLPMRRWKLYFRIRTQAEYKALLDHYKGQNGDLTPFYWRTAYIPAHINPDSEDYFYVRYSSFDADPIAWGVWDVSMEMEEAL